MGPRAGLEIHERFQGYQALVRGRARRNRASAAPGRSKYRVNRITG